MENKITYAEINEWARSLENKGYYYKKIHPTYKVLGVSINQYGEKASYYQKQEIKRVSRNLQGNCCAG